MEFYFEAEKKKREPGKGGGVKEREIERENCDVSLNEMFRGICVIYGGVNESPLAYNKMQYETVNLPFEG